MANGNLLRVVFTEPAPYRLPGLCRVMAAGDMAFKEVSSSANAIGRLAAQMLPDVAVCYCRPIPTTQGTQF